MDTCMDCSGKYVSVVAELWRWWGS